METTQIRVPLSVRASDDEACSESQRQSHEECGKTQALAPSCGPKSAHARVRASAHTHTHTHPFFCDVISGG